VEGEPPGEPETRRMNAARGRGRGTCPWAQVFLDTENADGKRKTLNESLQRPSVPFRVLSVEKYARSRGRVLGRLRVNPKPQITNLNENSNLNLQRAL